MFEAPLTRAPAISGLTPPVRMAAAMNSVPVVPFAAIQTPATAIVPTRDPCANGITTNAAAIAAIAAISVRRGARSTNTPASQRPITPVPPRTSRAPETMPTSSPASTT
ncbi:hypothetical protein [Curtobacterium sp. MCPF17_052]|uniref:hypothetical protein n=1 Tax=Curtobacterium sp. MCPF17_052 TaxID=2175655 RepID=UPI0024E02CB6|nr:hypothetical protein [Curtobacterium sp. MCPF17_052]WIB12659.1 hypothetical protein DEJ36_00475 [Curtobacterium sp. MCPF17_052]